ncbi:MAG: NADH:flavin oxidoreductase [Nitrospira sp.]|nr:NADH:flavin oxidoreductase [bacterium]MBL7048582.1 NADH:flavin oxidoreductase [Nitrospira sp.]
MEKIFEISKINNLELQNRFVRSATWEGMADEQGFCTDKLSRTMVNLAKGGVGLIITGHLYVQQVGQASPFQLAIYEDKFIDELKAMTDEVHYAGGKIIAQIAHAGCQGSAKMSGLEPVGPSVLQVNGKALCREMTTEEINVLIQDFTAAAVRAKTAGFDGVQLHGAHGYLFNQFLSGFYNKRTDEYGGSLQNRMRALLATLRAIRAAVGDTFPIMIKLNSEDFLDGGLTREDVIDIAAILEKEGIDAIEYSGGTIQSDKKLVPVRVGRIEKENEAFYREAAAQYKKRIKVPLLLVGGIRSFETAEAVINEGIADYISMSRPFIREPELINTWQSGERSPAACISCNACFRPGVKGEGIYCVAKEKEEQKKTD